MIVRVQVIGDKVEVTAGSDWEKAGDWWYYKKILTPAGTAGAEASAITAEVDGEGDFDIIVVHEASRTVYDGDKLAVPNGWDATAVGKIALQ
jgi:hypothetical protein